MRDAQEPFSAEPQPVIGATAADWRGLLVPVLNPEKQALAGYPQDDSPYVVVLAILKSAPRDVLMFSLQPGTAELKLIGLQVFTFH
jgi:hypothetical protein